MKIWEVNKNSKEFGYEYESLEMPNLPLEGMTMRKVNNKALTKVVSDRNHYKYA